MPDEEQREHEAAPVQAAAGEQHESEGAEAGAHDEPEDSDSLLPYPIVAIGASAGGLEAYIELLRNVAPDTGMAFVLIPHLSPDHESHLSEILARTSTIPVQNMESGAKPEPNQVYILPPRKRAVIERGVFRLEPRQPGDRVPMPIDHFFRSLAADQKNRAIAVILSGADSDGAQGMKAVKSEGGIAIVQDPDSARFSEMPRSGILADHVDIVLPPAQIGVELSRLARQFYQPALQQLEEGAVAPADEPHFTRIIALLRTVSGVDFRNYKPGTLRRRIGRRLMLRRLDTLAEYGRYLQENRQELRNLHEDILISVTRFFRDPDVFETLKNQILPGMIDNRHPDQQVRVWVAGCSTGEEAYSLAICLLEYLGNHPVEPPIQIFGTDASDRSIDKARMGLYPESIANDIDAERLRRFFIKTDKGYQVTKRVRDLCIFARQNLCIDPPFSRLDLISCRNLLIYLLPETQRTIIGTFHYALRPAGCLLLGRSESVPDALGVFTPLDRKNKFYLKIGETSPQTLMALPRAPLEVYAPPATPSVPGRTAFVELDVQRAADRAVLARYGPPGVLVNEQMEVLDVRGHPSPFLTIGPGPASLNLVRMAHPDILPAVRETFRRAAETSAVTSEHVTVHQPPHSSTAQLEILPIQAAPGHARHFLVLFSSSGTAPNVERESTAQQQAELLTSDPEQELARLRRDLSTTRVYLQSLIEDRDARNQELTAAYEEIQSANEELQSTNEELETAKEELQSGNEELQTLNDELRNRNTALLHASNDLSNLLNSVNIPIIMLGGDLTIRQFTPPAERLMRLRAADIGRPIGEIRLNLAMDDIEPLIHEVLDTLAVKELEVQDRAGRWHVLRVRPYRTTDNKIDGAVLLLLDIDQMKRAQDALQQARDFAQAIFEGVQAPVAVLDAGLRIRACNASFRSMAGFSIADLERRSFTELIGLLWEWPNLGEPLQRLIRGESTAQFEHEHETTRPPRRSFRLAARRASTAEGPAVLVAIEDITAQRQADTLLQADRRRLAEEVQSTSDVLGRTREELHALAARLFTSQEEERKRVARELHDDLSQKLALLEIDVDRLSQDLPSDPEATKAHLNSLRQRLSSLSGEVRSLSHQLHPSALEDLGLAPALKSLVEQFSEREGMVCTFRSGGSQVAVSPELAVSLYRIAQEALRNVAKHAGRTHVKVILEETEDAVRLEVRDFGEGFDMDSSARRGLGLVSMDERARLIGATFAVQSALGEGTTVAVTVPLSGASR